VTMPPLPGPNVAETSPVTMPPLPGPNVETGAHIA
jgi:hypothetical protein